MDEALACIGFRPSDLKFAGTKTEHTMMLIFTRKAQHRRLSGGQQDGLGKVALSDKEYIDNCNFEIQQAGGSELFDYKLVPVGGDC